MVATEKIEFRKIRDFGEIINVTFDFIRQNFKNLFLSLLFIAGPMVLLSGIAKGISQNELFATNMIGAAYFFTLFIQYLFFFLTLQLITAVTYAYVMLYLEGSTDNIEVNDVWTRTKKYITKIFLTSIGAALIIIVSSLLLILGIYFAVILSIIYIVRLNENLSFSESVSRCKYLVKNNWWYTLGLIIILSVIQGVLSFLLELPVYIHYFISLFHFMQGSVGNSLVSIIVSIIAAFGNLFYSISFVGLTFYYFNLVERKEAKGLLERLESINAPELI